MQIFVFNLLHCSDTDLIVVHNKRLFIWPIVRDILSSSTSKSNGTRFLLYVICLNGLNGPFVQLFLLNSDILIRQTHQEGLN